MAGTTWSERKETIHRAFRHRLQEDVAFLKRSIQETQMSANEETKSSAGDKYETGRAMAHLEIEKLSLLLQEKQVALQFLDRLNYQQTFRRAEPGSLVETSSGFFYIAVHGGHIMLDGIQITAISAGSPLAKALHAKEPGQQIVLKGREIKITNIF